MAKRIMVIGFMPIEQFEDDELDPTRKSGLTEQVENDLTEELGEDLDDISFDVIDDEERNDE